MIISEGRLAGRGPRLLRAAKTLRYTPQDSKLWHLAKKRLIELVGQLEKD